MERDKTHCRIMIAGAGKSGTSGLYHCVLQSAECHFERKFAQLFEPKTLETLAALSGPFAVTKVLSERLSQFSRAEAVIASFDKRIMIVRDPRDNVVSRLLWLIATRISEAEPAAAKAVLDALALKERDPQSVSVLDLYDIAAPVAGYAKGYAVKARGIAYMACDMLETFRDFHILKYEDFVDRTFGPTEAYLGFPLIAGFELPERAGKILRTGTYGNWANWFLDEDIAFFVTAERERMARLGYASADAPAVQRRINRDEATGYIARVVESIRTHGR